MTLNTMKGNDLTALGLNGLINLKFFVMYQQKLQLFSNKQTNFLSLPDSRSNILHTAEA